jgi:hypothetical protein
VSDSDCSADLRVAKFLSFNHQQTLASNASLFVKGGVKENKLKERRENVTISREPHPGGQSPKGAGSSMPWP